MWEVYLIIALVVIVVSVLWTQGIANMHKNHPDYKGDQDGFNFDNKEDEQEENILR